MKSFLIHAVEKDEFAYAIFEYSTDCEKMIQLLLREWKTQKTMERMRLLTENISKSQVSHKYLTSAELRKLFPLCFDSDKVTITYNIRDIFDKREFDRLSKKLKIYTYDLEKFNLVERKEDETKNKEEDDYDDIEIIKALKNIKIKNEKNKKKNKIIIIDDSDTE